jgi:hypothetical protein
MATTPRRRRTYTEADRERLLGEAKQLHATGLSWAAVAEQLALVDSTLHNWRATRGEGKFAPVVIDESQVPCDKSAAAPTDAVRGNGFTVVTPSGYRAEGLSFDGLVRLLRAIS